MSLLETSARPLDFAGDAVARRDKSALIERFRMEEQHHSNWCWAAVAVSVRDYYGGGSRIEQCDVANAELGRDDCCGFKRGTPGPEIDVTNVLGSPLHRVGCFARLARLKTAEPGDIIEEIDAGRPLCARTIWPGGGGHFLTIVGYRVAADGEFILTLADPFWGPSECSYASFQNEYQLLGGTWTDTYYTRMPEGDADVISVTTEERSYAHQAAGRP